MFILSCYIEVFFGFVQYLHDSAQCEYWALLWLILNCTTYAPISEKIAAIFEFLTKQKMFKNTGAEH